MSLMGKLCKEKRYTEQLGIKVDSGREQEIFKWFLASILFGHRIGENIAAKTYKEFEKERILSPDAILQAGWNKLVEILDKGGYVRYDFSTATKLLNISRQLKEQYGSLNALHTAALDSKNLERKLQEFKGIGPVTANIFLREMRLAWKKADPEPLPIVKRVARKMRIILPKNRKNIHFVRLEAALIRRRKEGKSRS